MAREKGMGNLQMEKSGRWTIRIGYCGRRISRSTGTRDRDKAEKMLMRILAPLGRGEKRLPLADVWCAYLRSPNRRDLAQATLESKQMVWMHFARWMERVHFEIGSLAEVTAESVAEYLAEFKFNHTATTYNNRVCVLREIFHVLAEKAGLVDDPWYGVRLRPDDAHTRRELSVAELRRLLEAAKHVDAASCRVNGEAAQPAASQDASLHDRPDREIRSIGSIRSVGVDSEYWTLFLIGIYTGLRLGDCCQLRWDSIDLARGIIQVIPSKTRKHAHGRPVTIPIHPVLETALRAVSRRDEGERDQGSGIRDQRGRDQGSGIGDERGNRDEVLGMRDEKDGGESGALGDRALPVGEAGRAGSIQPAGTLCDANSQKADRAVADEVGVVGTSLFAKSCVSRSDLRSEYVLPTIAATYRSARWRVSEAIARIFKAANIEMHVKIEGRARPATEASFHSLRHTFVSFAANAGVPLAVVQSIVGHSTSLMTRHYYHESEAALKSAVAALPAL